MGATRKSRAMAERVSSVFLFVFLLVATQNAQLVRPLNDTSRPLPVAADGGFNANGTGQDVLVGQAHLYKQGVMVAPGYLEWGEQQLCRPSLRSFAVINEMNAIELAVLSVWTDDTQFQVLHFQRATLAAQSQLEVQICYLPQQLGDGVASVMIRTNMGELAVPLHGTATPSIYQVQPQLGMQVPVGSPLKTAISMHNPSQDPVDVLLLQEINTLTDLYAAYQPKAEKRRNWRLAAHESVEILMHTLQPRAPGRFRSLVRVDVDIDTLVIPFEGIAYEHGLAMMPDSINVGTMTSSTSHHSCEISVTNNGPQDVVLFNVTWPSNDANLLVNSKDIIIRVGQKGVAVAVHYVAAREGTFRGHIGMSFRPLPLKGTTHEESLSRAVALDLEYQAVVAHGSLAVAEDKPLACSERQESGELSRFCFRRGVTLRNEFKMPLLFWNAISYDEQLEVEAFPTHEVVLPHTNAPQIVLRYKTQQPLHCKNVQLKVTTNLSILSVELPCYSGQVVMHVIDKAPVGPNLSVKALWLGNRPPDTAVDFGAVAVNASQFRYLVISNANPMEVLVYSMATTLPELSWQLAFLHHAADDDLPDDSMPGFTCLSTAPGGGSALCEAGKPLDSNMDPRAGAAHPHAITDLSYVTLLPGDTAIFMLRLRVDKAKTGSGDVIINTSHETQRIPVRFVAQNGLVQCFVNDTVLHTTLGNHTSTMVHATSTFDTDLVVRGWHANDSRFSLHFPFHGVVGAHQSFTSETLDTLLAEVTFRAPPLAAMSPAVDESDLNADANMKASIKRTVVAACGERQWSGEPLMTVLIADLETVLEKERTWQQIKDTGGNKIESQIQIQTDVGGNCSVNVNVHLRKPSVLFYPDMIMPLQFPLTQIGRFSELYVEVFNPVHEAVHVELRVPLELPPKPYDANDDATSIVKAPPMNVTQMAEAFLTLVNSSHPEGPKMSVSWDLALGGKTGVRESTWARKAPEVPKMPEVPSFVWSEKARLSACLRPKERVRLGPLRFYPRGVATFSALVVIRSNLTGGEAIVVEGDGGAAKMYVRGDAYTPNGALLFRAFTDTAQLPNLTDTQGKVLWSHPGAQRVDAMLKACKLFTSKLTVKVVNAGNMDMTLKKTRVTMDCNMPGQCSGGISTRDDTGSSCSSHHFKIPDCNRSIVIRPGKTVHLPVQFKPSWASDIARARLLLDTSLEMYQFQVEIHMPADLRAVCQQAQAQLKFRAQIIGGVTGAVGGLLICAVFACCLSAFGFRFTSEPAAVPEQHPVHQSGAFAPRKVVRAAARARALELRPARKMAAAGGGPAFQASGSPAGVVSSGAAPVQDAAEPCAAEQPPSSRPPASRPPLRALLLQAKSSAAGLLGAWLQRWPAKDSPCTGEVRSDEEPQVQLRSLDASNKDQDTHHTARRTASPSLPPNITTATRRSRLSKSDDFASSSASGAPSNSWHHASESGQPRQQHPSPAPPLLRHSKRERRNSGSPASVRHPALPLGRPTGTQSAAGGPMATFLAPTEPVSHLGAAAAVSGASTPAMALSRNGSVGLSGGEGLSTDEQGADPEQDEHSRLEAAALAATKHPRHRNRRKSAGATLPSSAVPERTDANRAMPSDDASQSLRAAAGEQTKTSPATARVSTPCESQASQPGLVDSTSLLYGSGLLSPRDVPAETLPAPAFALTTHPPIDSSVSRAIDEPVLGSGTSSSPASDDCDDVNSMASWLAPALSLPGNPAAPVSGSVSLKASHTSPAAAPDAGCCDNDADAQAAPPTGKTGGTVESAAPSLQRKSQGRNARLQSAAKEPAATAKPLVAGVAAAVLSALQLSGPTRPTTAQDVNAAASMPGKESAAPRPALRLLPQLSGKSARSAAGPVEPVQISRVSPQQPSSSKQAAANPAGDKPTLRRASVKRSVTADVEPAAVPKSTAGPPSSTQNAVASLKAKAQQSPAKPAGTHKTLSITVPEMTQLQPGSSPSAVQRAMHASGAAATDGDAEPSTPSSRSHSVVASPSSDTRLDAAAAAAAALQALHGPSSGPPSQTSIDVALAEAMASTYNALAGSSQESSPTKAGPLQRHSPATASKQGPQPKLSPQAILSARVTSSSQQGAMGGGGAVASGSLTKQDALASAAGPAQDTFDAWVEDDLTSVRRQASPRAAGSRVSFGSGHTLDTSTPAVPESVYSIWGNKPAQGVTHTDRFLSNLHATFSSLGPGSDPIWGPAGITPSHYPSRPDEQQQLPGGLHGQAFATAGTTGVTSHVLPMQSPPPAVQHPHAGVAAINAGALGMASLPPTNPGAANGAPALPSSTGVLGWMAGAGPAWNPFSPYTATPLAPSSSDLGHQPRGPMLGMPRILASQAPMPPNQAFPGSAAASGDGTAANPQQQWH